MSFSCSPHILWLQDADQILLTHTGDKRAWLLREERAFIWDMLCHHRKPALILKMFARIYPEHDAGRYFADLLSEWHAEGILLAEEKSSGEFSHQ